MEKKNYRGKKSNNHGKGAKPTAEKSQTASNSTSLLNYFAVTPQLLTDSASISFSEPTGGQYSTVPDYNTKKYAIPGIMVLSAIPTIGKAGSAISPVNVASRNVYNYVRHANAGHTNYDSPDLMMYLLAMDSLYAYYSWMVRTYGLMSFYTQKNRYVPDQLIAGSGVDRGDISGKMSDFRAFINQSALRIGSLCVPRDMPLFQWHSQLFQNVFMDAPSVKAQLYLINPECVFKYSPYTDPQGTELVPVQMPSVWNNTFWTLDQIKDNFNTLANALLGEEDVNIMSGDILKAYGRENLVQLGSIPEDYVVVPDYNTSVLTMIHNLSITGYADYETLNIRQTQVGDTPTITHNPAFKTVSIGSKGPKLFTLPTDEPTPADVMLASRWSNIVDSETALNPADPLGDQYITLDSFGSEIFTMASILRKREDDSGNWVNNIQQIFRVMDAGTASNTVGAVQTLTQLEKFDWHPAVRIINSTSNNTWEFWNELQDVENYTILSKTDLSKMHETAVLSEFAVPVMGYLVKK